MRKSIIRLCLLSFITACCFLFSSCFLFKEKTADGAVDLSKTTYQIQNADGLTFRDSPIHPVVEFYFKDELIFTIDTALYCSCSSDSTLNDFSVCFSDAHTASGNHSFVLSSNDSHNYKGSKTVNFTILAVDNAVSTFEQFISLIDERADNINVIADITIPSEQTVASFSHVNLNGNAIYNYGKFLAYEDISLSNGAEFFNYGKFTFKTNTANVLCSGDNCAIYTNSDIDDAQQIDNGVAVYRRYDLQDICAIEYLSHEYTGQPLTPTITFGALTSDATSEDYIANYYDNKNIGTATVVVIPVDERSHFFHGQKEFTFEITAHPITVTTQQDAERVLADVNYSDVTLNGAFTNLTINEWADVKSIFSSVENLTVNGKLTVISRKYGNTLEVTNTLINNGEIIIQDNEDGFSGLIVNNFTNNFGATLTALDSITVSGTLSNSGLFTSKSNIFLLDQGVITPSSNIQNHGLVVYDDVGAFKNHSKDGIVNVSSGRVHERRQVLESDILSVTNPTYSLTGSYSLPSYQLDYDGLQEFCSSSDYYIEYYQGSQKLSMLDCVDAGDYKAKLIFNKQSPLYYGEVTFDWQILMASVTVGTSAQNAKYLYTAINCGNYDEIYLTNEKQTSYTLDSNCYNNLATLYIGEGCQVKVKNGYTLTLYGIQNNGVFLNEGVGGHQDASMYNRNLTIRDGGFINNGTAYLNDADTTTGGEGQTFVRYNIADCILNIPNNLVYGDGIGIDDAVTIDNPMGDRLVLGTDYSLPRAHLLSYAGTNIEAKITSPEFSTKNYGSISFTFNRQAGEITVYNQQELESALSDVSVQGICNYKKVKFGCDIAVVNESGEDYIKTITVYENTILALGDYTWTIDRTHENYTTIRITVVLNGQLSSSYGFTFTDDRLALKQ